MQTILGAGLSLKPQHFGEAVQYRASQMWFEVHPENYLMAGGPRLAWLEAVRSQHQLSLHGVSLSLAGAAAPDQQHLQRLAALIDRVQPALISEHLAWSTLYGHYFPDLLPMPRTNAVLACVAANIAQTQDTLKRRIAIENPSHYLQMAQHDWSETDFLTELTRRTGCGLLLDVNNVCVSAHNLGYDAVAYLDALPATAIDEIHLAGHSEDHDADARLLIDSHDAAVAPAVWQLYRHLIGRIGPQPTLIERDDKIPAFGELLAERELAQQILTASGAEQCLA